MIPDIRPISVLTPEILASSEWWAFIDEHFTDIRLSDELLWSFSINLTSYADIVKCCPVTRDKYGMHHAAPWPVLDGEQEIEEFTAFTKRYDKWSFFGPFADTRKETTFCLEIRTGDGDIQAISKLALPPEPGMEPVERQGNRWVWSRPAINTQPDSERS